MTNVFLGQILMFGGGYAPRHFAFCNGQLMSIQQNSALFSLVGTAYGGDGVNTFALPNLQSRLPVAQGQGPGLSNYQLGQTGGVTTVTLTTANMPGHNHMLMATKEIATTPTIASNVLPGQPTVGNPPAFYGNQPEGQPPLTPYLLAPAVCGPAGGNQAHSNLMPSLCISFIIALTGVFPSRN